jgi:hypothetical protein
MGVLILLVLHVAGPVSGAGPLDDSPLASTEAGQIELPSLPVPIPSIVLPTLPLPVPTLPPLPPPRPTLPPLPSPTLPPPPTPTLPPVPSVLPSLPTVLPSLPAPSLSPTPPPSSGSPAPSGIAAAPSAGGGGGTGASRGPAGATGGEGDPANDVFLGNGPVSQPPGAAPLRGDQPSAGLTPSIGELIAPGLLVGIPLLTLLLILAGQLGVGAAWLPVVRRWLNRPLLPGAVQRAANLVGRGDRPDGAN